MKTIGEILMVQRKKIGLSLEELSAKTKIDIRYLEAIEKNNFKLLPSTTFTKGFIRNISLVLGKNPHEMIAFYRRDFQTQRHIPQNRQNHFLSINKSALSHSQIPLILLGLFLFFAYLIFKYRTVIIPPRLEIVRPTKNQVVASPVIIEGISTSDSVITVNDTNDVNTDGSGRFTLTLPLPSGASQIKIVATNRYGRISTVNIPITIVSQ